MLLTAKLLVFVGLLVGALVRHDVFFCVMLAVSALAILTSSMPTLGASPAPSAPEPDQDERTMTAVPDWEADR